MVEHWRACFVSFAQLHLKVHDRTAHLAYFPAYHLWYVQGEKYTGADIVPAEYDALVGGGPQARVAAELHASPMKSRVGGSGVCCWSGDASRSECLMIALMESMSLVPVSPAAAAISQGQVYAKCGDEGRWAPRGKCGGHRVRISLQCPHYICGAPMPVSEACISTITGTMDWQ